MKQYFFLFFATLQVCEEHTGIYIVFKIIFKIETTLPLLVE